MTNFKNKCKDFFFKSGIMTKTDYIIMGILTLIFTVLVFFKLGNTYAPQTYHETTVENHDIIIDFGDYITVEKLNIFLGNESTRTLSLSAYNEVTKEWEVFNSEAKADSVFAWNTVDIYYTLRYLGIVCTDEEGVFNEFVFTGPDGIITPANADKYPELFDEQDMFYKTKESTYMDGTMFDEVYHGRTGYEFVHGLPTYETTHPQLGKCLIALGIKMFGMTPFGWRFFTALFGIFFVPLMYIFAKVLFRDTFIATAIGVFIAFDNMHFTLSRIATIDIFVAFFIILAYLFLYRYLEVDNEYRSATPLKGKKQNIPLCTNDKFPPRSIMTILALCGISMGFAIATKLTGVYAAVGIAIIFLYHTFTHWPGKQAKRMFWFCVVFFICIPLISYTLAYIPSVEKYAQMGYTDKTITWNENGLYIGYGWTGLLARTLRNTNYMIRYHANLQATHYYQSAFYEWPVMWMPLLASNRVIKEVGEVVTVSSVNYVGNPLIWWGQIPCVLYVIYKAIRKRDKNAVFLAVSYFAQYIPWFGVERCTFIYHYLPSMLFGIFMMGYCIKDLLAWKPALEKYVKIFLIAVVIMFFIFYPVSSGMPISKEWGLHLRWLPDWILVL